MTPTYMRRLADIAEKPSISPSVKLVTTRRMCRVFAQGLIAIHDERRALKRMAAKQKEFLPFSAQRMADLERQASEHRSESLTHFHNSLTSIGIALLLDKEGLAASLGFDRLCDVLSINPVHRDQARQEGEASICALAFSHRLEDSADLQREGRGYVWGDGGPLFQACLRGWVLFARDCQARDIDPFAPGEVFGPPSPPVLRLV